MVCNGSAGGGLRLGGFGDGARFGGSPILAIAHDGHLECRRHFRHQADADVVDAQVAQTVLQFDAAAINLEANQRAQFSAMSLLVTEP
jgi:hypothetical protein